MKTPDFLRTGALVLALLLSPTLASAQLGPPVSFEISGTAGALVPTSSLANATQAGTTEDLEASSNFAFGANLAVLLPIGFTLEAQGLLAPGSDLEQAGTSSDWLALTGAFIYRFPVPVVSALVQPFVGAGAGVRSHSFDDFESLSLQQQAALGGSDSSSDFVADVMLGTYINAIPGLKIRLEARDYLSSFGTAGGDSNFQNDLTFLAGLGFEFP